MRACAEDGTGWRGDECGNWWPCGEIGPLASREERARRRGAVEAETAREALAGHAEMVAALEAEEQR